MDPSQVSQLLTWLDQEHRKDKALLIELQGQVNAYEPRLAELTRQLQEIQAVLTVVESQLPKLERLDDSLQSARTEFANLMEQQAAEQGAQREQWAQTQKLESETKARIIRQLQERVEAFGSFESSAALLRDEDGRLQSELTKVLDQLSKESKRLDTQEQRMGLLTEDTHVFREGLTNIKVAHDDLSTQSMTLKATLDGLESRLDSRIAQFQSSLEGVSEGHKTSLAAFQVKLQEQDRLADESSNRVNAFQTRIGRWTKQIEQFTNQFERNRKTLYDLQELEKQMRQQGNELLELQRLSAERQKTELREWQDAQIRVDDEQMARLEPLEAWQQRAMETMESLGERLQEDRQEVETCIEELWQVWAKYLQGQLDFLDSTVSQHRTD